MAPLQRIDKEFSKIANQVETLLKEANARSKKNGKPLLILIGEDHLSGHAALLETLIYKHARPLGISNIALEFDKGFVQTMDKMAMSTTHENGTLAVYWQARYFKAKIHPVDGRADIASEKIQGISTHPDKKTIQKVAMVEERNVTIAANLVLIHRPTLMVTGNGHLPGLFRNAELQKTHEIICFDVTSPEFKSSESSDFKAAHRLAIHDVFAVLGLTPDQIFKYGMGSEEGTKFCEWAKQKGHLTANKALATPHQVNNQQGDFSQLVKDSGILKISNWNNIEQLAEVPKYVEQFNPSASFSAPTSRRSRQH